VRQAWPRQGSEFIAEAGQGLATPARRRKRWQRDCTAYWVKNTQMIIFTATKHIQIHAFPSPRVGQDGIRSSFQ
jgi:hypothetical protein